MKKEYLFAAVSILLWSTTSTVTKLLLGNLDSFQILLISSLFAFVFLFLINLKRGKLKELKMYSKKDYLCIMGLGILGTFLYNLFLYLGIDKMNASQAFIINYLWPIMTVIFACILLKEKFTLKKAIAVLVSFIGVIIVTADGNILKFNVVSVIGAIYCILAAIAYGLFSVLNKQRNYDTYLSMMLFYFVSFILSCLYILIFGDFFVPNSIEFFGLLWLGVFKSAIAFSCWAKALKIGDTVKVSNLAYITPFLSLVWAFIILGEDISFYSILGLFVIIFGIFIQLYGDMKTKNK